MDDFDLSCADVCNIRPPGFCAIVAFGISGLILGYFPGLVQRSLLSFNLEAARDGCLRRASRHRQYN